MKIRLSLLCIALAIIAFNVADAQHHVQHSLSDGAFAQPTAQRFFRQFAGQSWPARRRPTRTALV